MRSTARILGITPFERPDPAVAVALCRAGALGAVDLGRDLVRGLAAVEEASGRVADGLGVRIHDGAIPDPEDLPATVGFVILPAGADPAPWSGRRRFVRVTTLAEAVRAEDAGADAVIVAGHEAAGRHGDQGTFVLLQRALGRLSVPVWAQGGIGLRSAAACVAGGAAGVVLDSQLALARESSVPDDVRRAVAAMDGTEAVSLDGFRVFDRPDLDVRGRVGEGGRTAAEALAGGDDLREQLVPVGQDGGVAKEVADRFGTVGGIVGGFRRHLRDALEAAAETRPLAPGAPLADAMGTTYPLLQGPMTRVSDRAPFSRAVADGGALPFLALSLLRGKKLRALLAETAEIHGDQPWGVGILGFAPQEIRAQQLELIEEVRPPFALIAGGRPAQARALEKLGIRTFLHVPSEGLLDLFLREGATRFVFEGRECGGHVGPLSSLALWDRQIHRLLEHDRPEELTVVFAGGIHDARSAAMVAALAAPLAARGAKIGALMGTAYLFTEEAVASGAILPAYQEAVRTCEETVLLETSPGHATRCAHSDFVEAFRRESDRLAAEGVDAKERWMRLEQLNLGRLRIASKGLRRDGDTIVEVDETVQRREGMYMLGDVATMRDAVTTVEALHREVSEGSVTALPEPDAPEVRTPAGDGRIDVAIVGMACVFPGASDLDQYWYNITHGVDSVREVSPERWDPDIYFDPDGEPGETTPSKWGGFLDPVPFDPARYGIPPSSLVAIDPIQLLSLEVSRRALEDAGYADREFDRERTAVIFGAEGGTDLSKAYGFRALYPQYVGTLPDDLETNLPSTTEDSFPGVLTNVIAGRIANRLDLGGENFTVNAACASSLASLSIAGQWLQAGSADMVLVGGADVHNSIGDFLMFSSVHALSRHGRCRTFDQDADGITLGEGVGVVVVKRLDDAVRDGDRVYAVVRGIGGSSDGKSLGLTAPRPEGQLRAYRRAYEMADVSPAEVGLMEAHGTGTVVGDRTELATMDDLMTGAGAAPGSCALGSVKSQIGHLKGAAGIASVIKSALALHHRVLTPTIHVKRPNKYWEPGTSPFTLSDRPRPWLADRRVAAVSAFGFGGTNYHTVLEEWTDGERPESGHARWPAELFLFRGADRPAALARVDALETLLAADPPWELADLARSTSAGGEGPVQIAVVARDRADLADRLGAARRGEAQEDGVFLADTESPDPGGVALLFPGQGSQYPGMLDEQFVAFPWLTDLLEHDREVARIMHPPKAFTPAEGSAQQEALKATDVAQVALGMADMAMARILEGLGITGDMLAGHSYGEMVALRRAGVWSDADLLRLSRTRALAILEAAGDDPGAMVAAQAGPDELESLLEGLPGLVMANQNAPDQTILSGPTTEVEEVTRRLEDAAIRATRLPVACAFHSGVVADARGPFLDAMMDTATAAPEAEVWANATAERYPDDPDALRELLADQLARPVLFAKQLEAMYEAGARTFVEVGPGRVLSGLVDRVLGDRPHAAVPLDVKGEPAMERMLCGLARLATLGVELDAEFLHRGRPSEAFDLDDPPARSHPPLTWLVDGHYARPLRGDLPEGALRPVTELPPPGQRARVATPTANGGAPVAGGGDAVVIEYLRNIREMAEAQRQVVMGYLGSVEPARIPAPATRALEAPRPSTTAPVDVAAPAASTPAPEPTAGAEEQPLSEVLLQLVSERTGYPPEMLDVDLDLEADLSIDSIKRIEILGMLNERIGLADKLGDNRDELLEELSALKTLRGIQSWIEERTGVGAEGDAAGAPAEGGTTGSPSAAHAGQETDDSADEEPGDDPGPGGGGAAGPAPAEVADAADAPEATNGTAPAPVVLARHRFESRSVPLPEMNGTDFDGATFVITDDGRGVARALAERLEARGAHCRIVTGDEAPGEADGFVHLAPLADDADSSAVKSLFNLIRTTAEKPARWVLSAAGSGGIAGFLRSLAKEWADGLVRAVDLTNEESPETVADRLLAELADGDGPVVVRWAGDDRSVTEAVPAPLSNGKEASTLALEPGSVILVTGGARGITARVSVELARRFGCTLELVGRSPAPSDDESPETADAADMPALRARLAQLDPDARPAEVDTRARRILAAREIRETLRAIEVTGARVRYHALDVRDDDAFEALLESLYDEHGRIDGVIHGAGTTEDKLLKEKSPESFDRVFDTKVKSALTLARTLRPDTRFVAFFSSAAGTFGNRGQTDYAAANDVLDAVARELNDRLDGRVVSVAWGPWDETGMVTPELRREYARRRIGLIPPDAGVRALFEELALGPEGEANVLLMAGLAADRD